MASVVLCGSLSLDGSSAVLRSALANTPPASEGCTEPFFVELSDLKADKRRTYKEVSRRQVVVVRRRGDGCRPNDIDVLGACVAHGQYAYRPHRVEKGGALGQYISPPTVTRADLGGLGCESATDFVRRFEVGPDEADPGCRKGHWRSTRGCSRILRMVLAPFAAAPSDGDMVELTARDRHSFSLDRSEVTAGAYRACVDNGACKAPPSYDAEVRDTFRHCTYEALGKEQHPINCVTYAEAAAYCRFVGKRLPTETEWDAAWGPSTGPFVWGEAWPPPPRAGNFADEVAQDAFPEWIVLHGYIDGFAETGPVRAFGADRSEKGILGLAGNVREWVASDTPRRRSKRHVARGASFGEAEKSQLKANRRLKYARDVRSAHIGFRCAVSKKRDT